MIKYTLLNYKQVGLRFLERNFWTNFLFRETARFTTSIGVGTGLGLRDGDNLVSLPRFVASCSSIFIPETLMLCFLKIRNVNFPFILGTLNSYFLEARF